MEACATSLHTLNVSGNMLDDLRGVRGCAQLQTLMAADNHLTTGCVVEEVAVLEELETLDLQGNDLADVDVMLRMLCSLPRLKCLYLKGNPLVRDCQNYRKRVIAALPELTYLDDRPVFDQERSCAQAW